MGTDFATARLLWLPGSQILWIFPETRAFRPALFSSSLSVIRHGIQYGTSKCDEWWKYVQSPHDGGVPRRFLKKVRFTLLWPALFVCACYWAKIAVFGVMTYKILIDDISIGEQQFRIYRYHRGCVNFVGYWGRSSIISLRGGTIWCKRKLMGT